MVKIDFKKEYVWIVLLLVVFQLFGFVYVPIPNFVSKALILFCSIYGMVFCAKRKIKLKIFIWAIFFFLFCSCVSGYFFRDQQIVKTFLASFVVYSVGWYFFFFQKRLSVDNAEKVIFFLAITYSVCYLIQYLVYPFLIFQTSMMTDNISNARLRVQGTALSSLGMCFFMCKGLVTNKKSSYFFTILCTLPILLMGFRTMMLASMVCLLLMVFIIKGISLKTGIILLFSALFVVLALNSNKGQTIMEDISQRQKTDTFDQKDYVRMVGLDYYMKYHFKTSTEKIFGSGMYYEGTPLEKETNYVDKFGIKWNDWGVLGLSFFSGIITISLMLLISVRLLLMRTPLLYLYLKMWLIYMLLCSVTTAEYLRLGNTVVLALVWYLTEIVSSPVRVSLFLKKIRAHNA